MDKRVIPALESLLKAEFPMVNTHQDFPSPHIRFRTPALALITANSRLDRFSPEIVEKIPNTSSSLPAPMFYQNVGQFQTTIKMHYFAKTKSAQYDFTTSIFNFFDKQQLEDEKTSPNIVFSYGSKDYEKATAQILDFQYLNQSEIVKSGEIRTIFDVLVDSPKIVRIDIPEATDIRITHDISEKVSI